MNIKPRTLCLALLAMLAAIPAARAADSAAREADSAAREADSAARETELIEKLQSDSPAAEKALACKFLAVYGTSQSVPELAKLLPDERLNSWSRIALEAIPGPAASEALRKAAESLQGRLLVGTINSLGVRRDEGSVEPLTGRLQDADADVASAAAVALGHIANPAATKSLRESLAKAPAKVRNAVAEGCILCAERLMNDGKTAEATEIYDEVRKAEVPKQKVLEATRGAILARKADGIPLLVEQLRSADNTFFQLGLGTARELAGHQAADALVTELASAAPERAALILTAIADRGDTTVLPAVLQAAKNGAKPVRIAAIGVVGRLGDATSLSALLEIAADSDSELAEAAKAALAGLPGDKINDEIVARLGKTDAKSLPVLLELIGQRRIDATSALVKAVESSDSKVRESALVALGATINGKDLGILIAQVVAPKNAATAEVAQKALRAACVRMPDREACAAELSAAMTKAPLATRSLLLEILGEMGGPKALATIAAAVKGNQPELQDTGSRVLGEWMEVDAAPVLLDLSKTAPSDKYQVRALRGYIRLARQFAGSDAKRAEMCQTVLDSTNRVPEQKLVITVLEKYPSPEALQVVLRARENPALKEDATRASLFLIQKLGDKAGDVKALLAKLGMDAVKVEIIKAEYGTGKTQKDVTETLQKQVRDLPLITLPAKSYSASFGGDPAPGTAKQLHVQYRINGKSGEASFAEDAIVMLPMPK